MNTDLGKQDATTRTHSNETGAANEAREQIAAERDQLAIQLDAWHSQFGTSQLSHAIAELDQLRKQLNQACDTLDFATSELQKSREQVKTLLAALNILIPMFNDALRCGRGIGTYFRQQAKVEIDSINAAIASVEAQK